MAQELNRRKNDEPPSSWKLLGRIEALQDEINSLKEELTLHRNNSASLIDMAHAQNKVIDDISDKLKTLTLTIATISTTNSRHNSR